MEEPASVYHAVIAVIREMGIEDTSLVRTVLVRDNRFVGRKYYYTGGYAICMAGSAVVEFYNDDGKLLITVQAPNETGLAA
jgi:hypothetical protein